jgi:hypothetical protein
MPRLNRRSRYRGLHRSSTGRELDRCRLPTGCLAIGTPCGPLLHSSVNFTSMWIIRRAMYHNGPASLTGWIDTNAASIQQAVTDGVDGPPSIPATRRSPFPWASRPPVSPSAYSSSGVSSMTRSSSGSHTPTSTRLTGTQSSASRPERVRTGGTGPCEPWRRRPSRVLAVVIARSSAGAAAAPVRVSSPIDRVENYLQNTALNR